MRLRLPMRRMTLRSRETPPLPARVRDTIRRQQASSEILVGWVQLTIVSTFSILYTLSPKPYTAEPVLAPEPWVLGAYLLFTLVRLVLAHRRMLPDWLLYLSVVLDMLLLLALIWSIHVKYAQPASFYLKVPTLLYVFIFIALRALRFQARYVLLAGAVAAGGWLLMVLYAIRVVPGDPMITRDYVQYMTSNSVLLGAEFDKVISILIVTGVLAVALTRARDLLVQSVVESTAAAELSRFVPSEVAAEIKASGTPVEAGAGEVRETTIFFSDLEGFTTLSEGMSPVEVISTLNEYFAAVSEPIVRHGGTVNQYQGDAILATFNLPAAREDHAARAVRAAIEIQGILASRTFGAGLRLVSRIGINTGVVVGGLVGAGDRLGYTVHGDDVNLAARLEALNKEHGTRIVVSGRTRELAGPGSFAFEALGTVTVRGRSGPVTVYKLDVQPGLRADRSGQPL